MLNWLPQNVLFSKVCASQVSEWNAVWWQFHDTSEEPVQFHQSGQCYLLREEDEEHELCNVGNGLCLRALKIFFMFAAACVSMTLLQRSCQGWVASILKFIEDWLHMYKEMINSDNTIIIRLKSMYELLWVLVFTWSRTNTITYTQTTAALSCPISCLPLTTTLILYPSILSHLFSSTAAAHGFL